MLFESNILKQMEVSPSFLSKKEKKNIPLSKTPMNYSILEQLM